MSETTGQTPEGAKTFGITPKGEQTFTATTRYEQAMARIEELQERNRFRGNMFTDWIDPEKADLLDILKAVLELHRPMPNDDEEEGLPQMCSCRMATHQMCPTAEKIIEGVLGE